MAAHKGAVVVRSAILARNFADDLEAPEFPGRIRLRVVRRQPHQQSAGQQRGDDAPEKTEKE